MSRVMEHGGCRIASPAWQTKSLGARRQYSQATVNNVGWVGGWGGGGGGGGGGGSQLQCIYYLVLYTDLKAAEGN